MVVILHNIFECIFMNEKFCVLIQISQTFVLKGPTDNKSVLVQIMAWCQTGSKPLFEPMLTQFTDAYMRYQGGDELRDSSREVREPLVP